MWYAVDEDEHLVQMSLVSEPRAPPVRLVGVALAELGAPLEDRFVGDHDPRANIISEISRRLNAKWWWSHTQSAKLTMPYQGLCVSSRSGSDSTQSRSTY